MKKLICALLTLLLSGSMIVGMTACGEAEDDEERLEQSEEEDNDGSDESKQATTAEQSGIVHEHIWLDATCTDAKTCSECGETEGDALGHDYSDGICARCGEVDPNALTPSEGLEFELNDDGESYEVSGIGTCADSFVVIPSEYRGLPVTSIEDSAFDECTTMTGIFVPESITEIGKYWTFYGCDNLKSIIVSENNPVYHSTNNCLIETESKTLIFGCQTSVIPDDGSVTKIEFSAFDGCEQLTSIFIPDTITSIKYGIDAGGAFRGCENLTSIVVSENNPVYHSTNNCIIETATKTLIGGCSTSIIPDDGSVVSIGVLAFHGFSDLNTIKIPNSIISIGYGAFGGCENLKSIVIPNSVTNVGSYAFSDCDYVYCEAPHYLFGFKEGWKSNSATVYWSGEWEYVEGVPTGTQTPSTTLSEEVCRMFDKYGFDEYYSYEEYYELVETLIAKFNDQLNFPASFIPVYPINDQLLFVQRTIDTYNFYEEAVAVVTTEGEIVEGWYIDWDIYDIRVKAKIGDYFFIEYKRDSSGYYYYVVVNNEGKIISYICCREKKYDIGEGYIFYTTGFESGSIMNPAGEVIRLQTASSSPSYGTTDGKLSDGQAIGQISEGLFYGISKSNVSSIAYYYNTNGEVVIDLSTRAVNFRVTKLSDFSDGQARIEFVGANGKNYYAFIDKTGNFIGEPIEQELM